MGTKVVIVVADMIGVRGGWGIAGLVGGEDSELSTDAPVSLVRIERAG